MNADTILSGLAVLIASGSFLYSYCMYKRHDKKLKTQQRQINEFNLKKFRQRKEDEKKAIIEANVIKGIRGKRTVKIYNKGKAIAKNVRVSFSDTKNVNISDFPSPIDIKPQKSINIDIKPFKKAPDMLKLNWEWQDEFSSQNQDSDIIQL